MCRVLGWESMTGPSYFWSQRGPAALWDVLGDRMPLYSLLLKLWVGASATGSRLPATAR